MDVTRGLYLQGLCGGFVMNVESRRFVADFNHFDPRGTSTCPNHQGSNKLKHRSFSKKIIWNNQTTMTLASKSLFSGVVVVVVVPNGTPFILGNLTWIILPGWIQHGHLSRVLLELLNFRKIKSNWRKRNKTVWIWVLLNAFDPA